jgi:hypothetical protein
MSPPSARRWSCRTRSSGLLRAGVFGFALDRDDLFVRVVGDDQEHLARDLIHVESRQVVTDCGIEGGGGHVPSLRRS